MVQGQLGMSRFPPLGYEYFQEYAQLHVDKGLTPMDLFYSFADVLDKEGNRAKFLLAGRSAELYLEGFVAKWRAKYGRDSWPHSDLVSDSIDPGAFSGDRAELSMTQSQIDKSYKVPSPRAPLVGATLPEYDPARGSWACELEGEIWLWRNDKFGGQSWQREGVDKNSILERFRVAFRAEQDRRDLAEIRAQMEQWRQSTKSSRPKRRGATAR